MTMLVQEFNARSIVTQRRVFDEAIETEPWIMFHGTSCFNAQAIEQDGFRCEPSVPSQSLHLITDIFEKMRWSGLAHGGGCVVLKSFSLGYAKSLFFAETSSRSLLYASMDFAGGEKLFAVRNAFAELDAYCRDRSLREEHLTSLAAKFRSRSRQDMSPTHLEKVRPVVVDLDWLASQIQAIDWLRTDAEQAMHRHEHGVAYAVRVPPNDIEGLSWNAAKGIEAVRLIPASWIVARVDVPSDFTPPPRSGVEQRSQFGLLAALRAVSG